MKTNRMLAMVGIMMMSLAIMLGFSAPFVAAEDGTEAVAGGWDSIMAIGATTLAVIGIVMYAVAYLFKDMGAQTKKFLTFGAAIMLVLAAFSFFGVTLTADNDVNPDPVPSAEWTATLADNSTDIVWTDQYHAIWQIHYNTTSNAIHSSNDSAVFTLNVGRTDDSSASAYDVGSVADIGTFVDPATSIEYPCITKGTDGLYEADWTDDDGNTYNMDVGLPTQGDGDRAGWANLTVEVSDGCVNGMIEGQGTDFTITWADYTWTITVQCYEIYA